jgi:hypothetical protein
MKLKVKTTRRWLLIVAAVFWSATALAQAPASSEVNVTGAWKGTRTATGGATRDYRVRSIKFDLTQNSETLSGSYQCYAGKKATSDCNNPVGRITGGKINANQIKIEVQAMPNNLICKFMGTVAGTKMNGKYSCYAGGSLSSIGVWNASRL